MKSIGFIDYFIDEWHANNYPRLIREIAPDAFDVTLAWEKRPKDGGTPLAEWCAQRRVAPAASIAEVVESCDCLVVLSPDNPEFHEELAELPLASGKPVYLDKPFAPTLAAARRLFARAEAHGTPLMSSSALRFGSAFEKALAEGLGGQGARFCATRGGGSFAVYAIHQLEMLVMALGPGASRVCQCGNDMANHMIVDYPDGRRGCITLMDGQPFQLSARGPAGQVVVNEMTDFFPRFVAGMLEFFGTGKSLAPAAETLAIIALVEAGIAALDTPGTWVDVPA